MADQNSQNLKVPLFSLPESIGVCRKKGFDEAFNQCRLTAVVGRLVQPDD